MQTKNKHSEEEENERKKNAKSIRTISSFHPNEWVQVKKMWGAGSKRILVSATGNEELLVMLY